MRIGLARIILLGLYSGVLAARVYQQTKWAKIAFIKLVFPRYTRVRECMTVQTVQDSAVLLNALCCSGMVAHRSSTLTKTPALLAVPTCRHRRSRFSHFWILHGPLPSSPFPPCVPRRDATHLPTIQRRPDLRGQQNWGGHSRSNSSTTTNSLSWPLSSRTSLPRPPVRSPIC